jgi:hypothetical protein
MEPFEPLTEFYETIADDGRISATHISLYIALLQQWNLNDGKNPIIINRKTIMNTAKISRRTYNKRINELQEYGYIQYVPSSNPFSGSVVSLRVI